MQIRKQIEAIRIMGSRKIAGVQCVLVRFQEREVNGVAYVMDYGVDAILDRYTFPKAITAKSKALTETIARMATAHPDAVINHFTC